MGEPPDQERESYRSGGARFGCSGMAGKDASGATGIDKIKDLIISDYPGNSRPVRRVHGDAVIVSNVTPSFRSVWSVFGDVSGMSGLLKPGAF